MTGSNAFFALAAILALAACQQQAVDNAVAPVEDMADGAGGTAAPPGPASPPAAEPAADVRPAGNEAAAPATPPLTGSAETGEKGARNILLSFARAIELKRFDEAYALLSATDRKRWSRSEFGAIFEDLGKITVAVPTGTMEGAAGSSYYSAPLAITSSDKDGRPVRIEGEAVLRRVNDVAGATPDQLRWRMDRVTLHWTH